MKLHIIYVPGLGDFRIKSQKLALSTWQVYGVTTEVCQMKWSDGQSFQPKLERILSRIDAAVAAGKPVAIVGTSAGASAALNAYALRKGQLKGVALICGKVLRPETISDYTYRANPAFRESMQRLDVSLPVLNDDDRARILSIHPFADQSVPVADTKLPGCREALVPTFGHAASIAATITIFSYKAVHFLRRQTN